MNIVLGPDSYDKREYLNNIIKNSTKTLILDYKDKWDIEGAFVIDMSEVRLRGEKFTLDHMNLVNAGAIEYQQILNKRAEQILKEDDEKNYEKNSCEYLLEQSLDRALNSWSESENRNVSMIYRHLTYRAEKQDKSIFELVKAASQYKTIILKKKDVHSITLRVLTFLFLYEFQKKNPEATFISYHLNILWKDAHLKNFFNSFQFMNKNNWYLCFTKEINVPHILLGDKKDISIVNCSNKIVS